MKTFNHSQLSIILSELEEIADTVCADVDQIEFDFSFWPTVCAYIPSTTGKMEIAYTTENMPDFSLSLAEFEAFVVKTMNEHLESSPLQPSGKLVLPADEKITIPVVGSLVFNSKLKFPFDSYHTKDGASFRVEWTSLIFDAHSISLAYNVD